jgi:hypothetical protein
MFTALFLCYCSSSSVGACSCGVTSISVSRDMFRWQSETGNGAIEK